MILQLENRRISINIVSRLCVEQDLHAPVLKSGGYYVNELFYEDLHQ